MLPIMIGMVMTPSGSTMTSAVYTIVALACAAPDNNNINSPIENIPISMLFIDFVPVLSLI
jgi:hypothetical protein